MRGSILGMETDSDVRHLRHFVRVNSDMTKECFHQVMIGTWHIDAGADPYRN